MGYLEARTLSFLNWWDERPKAKVFGYLEARTPPFLRFFFGCGCHFFSGLDAYTSATTRSGLASLEAQEDVMSINLVITVGIIALMFAWVPFLKLICPTGWEPTRSSSEKKQGETRPRTASVSSLSSRRLANQSHDLLHALSDRGGRGVPRSHADMRSVSPSSCAE